MESGTLSQMIDRASSLSWVINGSLSFSSGLWEIRTPNGNTPVTLESEAYLDPGREELAGEARTLITVIELWQSYDLFFPQGSRLAALLGSDEDDGDADSVDFVPKTIAEYEKWQKEVVRGLPVTFIPPTPEEYEKWKQEVVRGLEQKRKNSLVDNEYRPQGPTSYRLAQISSDSKLEHPDRADMIYLDFDDGGEWVWRGLVLLRDPAETNRYTLLINNSNCEKPNSLLELPPQGTYVPVLNILSKELNSKIEQELKVSLAGKYYLQEQNTVGRFAKITAQSKQEHHRRLAMINLDFGDEHREDMQWVWRFLVFLKDGESDAYIPLINDSNSEKPNRLLELPPEGTRVYVATIADS